MVGEMSVPAVFPEKHPKIDEPLSHQQILDGPDGRFEEPEGPFANALRLEAEEQARPGWLGPPRRINREWGFRRHPNNIQLYIALRFDAEQSDKVRASGDIRRPDTNSGAVAGDPAKLPTRGVASQLRYTISHNWGLSARPTIANPLAIGDHSFLRTPD